jgi:superfamily II DNA or RNA helicase
VPRFWGLSNFGLPHNDNRVVGSSVKVPNFGGTLRELQIECNSQALGTLAKWGGCTLLADCGFGKTATAIELAVSTRRKTLILCNREVLMSQWVESIRQFVPDCGPIGWIQGSSFDKGPLHTVRPTEAAFEESFFSIGSIVSFSEAGYSRDLLSSFGTVVLDEMHHIAAQSLVHVCPLFAALNVIGLTATPDRSDGLEYVLYWLAGPAAFIYQRLPSITGVSGSVEVEAVHFRGGNQKEVVYRNGNLG